MMRLWMILSVACGGAAGALLRWSLSAGVGQWWESHKWRSFPVGTLVVNLAGCVLLGFCYVWLSERLESGILRNAVNVGLIGALTTFSTYCLESFLLLEEHRYWAAAGNLAGSVVAGMVGVAIGVVIARLLLAT